MPNFIKILLTSFLVLTSSFAYAEKWQWTGSDVLEYPFPGRSSFGDIVYDQKNQTAYLAGGIGKIDRGGGIYFFSKKDSESLWSKPLALLATPYMRWGSSFDKINLALDANSHLFLQFHDYNPSTRSFSLRVASTPDGGTTWKNVATSSNTEANSYWIEKMEALPSGALVFLGNKDYRDAALIKLQDGQFKVAQKFPNSSIKDLRIAPNGKLYVLTHTQGFPFLWESSDEGLTWISTQLPLKMLAKVLLISKDLDLYVVGNTQTNEKCDELNIYKARESKGPWLKTTSIVSPRCGEIQNTISGAINNSGHIHLFGSLQMGANNSSGKVFVYSTKNLAGNWSMFEKQYADYKSVFPKKILATESGKVFTGANTSPGGNNVNDYFGLVMFGNLVP